VEPGFISVTTKPDASDTAVNLSSNVCKEPLIFPEGTDVGFESLVQAKNEIDTIKKITVFSFQITGVVL